MKTSRKVQGDIYRLLRESDLAATITGGIYREGMRPRDSLKEDAVVIFTTGQNGQVQQGVVTVNIYVPDIDPWSDGVSVEDTQRTEELETAAQLWVDSLNGRLAGYYFDTMQTIYTEEEPQTHQHFVVIRLRYRFGENN